MTTAGVSGEILALIWIRKGSDVYLLYGLYSKGRYRPIYACLPSYAIIGRGKHFVDAQASGIKKIEFYQTPRIWGLVRNPIFLPNFLKVAQTSR